MPKRPEPARIGGRLVSMIGRPPPRTLIGHVKEFMWRRREWERRYPETAESGDHYGSNAYMIGSIKAFLRKWTCYD